MRAAFRTADSGQHEGRLQTRRADGISCIDFSGNGLEAPPARAVLTKVWPHLVQTRTWTPRLARRHGPDRGGRKEGSAMSIEMRTRLGLAVVAAIVGTAVLPGCESGRSKEPSPAAPAPGAAVQLAPGE